MNDIGKVEKIAKALWYVRRQDLHTDDWAARPGEWSSISGETRADYRQRALRLMTGLNMEGLKIKSCHQ